MDVVVAVVATADTADCNTPTCRRGGEEGRRLIPDDDDDEVVDGIKVAI